MATLFNDRARAAEGIFVHDEELRFLAKRRGVEALAIWAADGMGLSREDAAGYAATVVRDFIGGMSEMSVAQRVQTDLERAGKPALSTHVGTVFDRAVAEALDETRSRSASGAPHDGLANPRAEWEQHHPRATHSWGWGL